ncbi:MAG TPA: hypothetical protein VE398_13130, partial [Acidobacteriota bacterium]|nr:hypothetical protein [Acidobacteriota bacterium]
AERLLGLVDRPRALLTSQLNNERGLPLVDVSALDKLIKSDYIGPLVERISKLQQDTQALEADKMRLERQLSWLPKAANVDLAQLPPGYQELIQTLSSELKAIIQSHNRLLDEYLTATITSLVMIRQSPIITREGSSATLILAVIVVMAGFLAIVVMSVEHLFQKARGLAGAPPEPNKAN